MGVKITTWDDNKTKQEIIKRLKNAGDARIYQEDRWIRNERVVYSTTSTLNMSYLQTSLESNFNIGLPGVDGSNADMNAAYTFKNLRFIHAQMSANPPSVVMRPTSSDQDDHRKADAADRIVRYAIRHYSMQERVDQLSLHTLLYGTGFVKTVWDSTMGDIIDFDTENDEMRLEGDISVTVPFIWNIFVDPDAKCTDEIKFVIERIYMDYDEAMARWPDKENLIKKARVERINQTKTGRSSQLQDFHWNCVEIYEYWETGLPTNGYLGRYCITTLDGDVLESCRPNPFRFRKAGTVAAIEALDLPDDVKAARIKKIPEMARLPYHILTDIDMPNMPWGRSFIEYTANLQDTLNKLDSSVIDNIQAHGTARMILPEATEISEDALSNSPWDVVKITGNQPPYFMGVPQLMPEMTSTRTNLIQGINDISGVNEAMFGQQSREQSGASMQYASNQGNMIRRRLFNKYVLVVESLYKAILDLVRKHWTIRRTIAVLGKEHALESIDLKGADIDGGYDVVGEYGVSLSLDPMTRREEIMMLQPLFEKAGVPVRTSLKMLKLNELEGLYDELSLAENRQKEIFDEMIATGRYIPPEEQQDHTNMIAFALNYFMTSEFKYLDPHLRELCKQHNKDRGALAAKEAGGPGQPSSPPAPGGAPAAPPGPVPSQPAGPLPTPAGSTGEPVTAPQAGPALNNG